MLAAAAAIPLLLLLYVLRLRRQRLRVPSTLLWQKSFEDLQANVPFQRLRWSLLLAIQLLLLLALLLALADPVVRGDLGAASRIVLLIDRSASMNALLSADEAGDGRALTRLDAAKQTALELVDRLGRSSEPGQMMVIAFGSQPQVVSTFQSDRGLLRNAIAAIEPTDEQADLEAALQLASAFASGREDPAEQPPDVVLLSDGVLAGGIPANASFRLTAGNFRFVQVVPDLEDPAMSNNVGIAAFSVRRDYEDPARVHVFGRLINAGTQPVTTVVTLFVDGQPAAAIRVTVPEAGESGPGEASVTHTLDLPTGATLLLRHNHPDILPADDVASLVLAPPMQPRIALVQPGGAAGPEPTGPDAWLRDLLTALEPQQLTVLSPEAYAALDAQQLNSASLYDLIVFDRVSPSRLPAIPTLTFGAVPPGLSAVEPSSEGGRYILSWDRQHPLMRQVSLDTIVFAGFGGYELPVGATPLAFGPDGPVIAVLRTRGARHIAVGFEMARSNWPLHVSSAVFLQNALDYLTLADSSQTGLVHRPGDPVSVRVGETQELHIEGPVEYRMAVQPNSTVTLPTIRRAGVYTIHGAIPPQDVLAVSVLSDSESDIRPRSSVPVNAEPAQGRSVSDTAPLPIWPWLIGLAFALAVLEWLVYCRRARGV